MQYVCQGDTCEYNPYKELSGGIRLHESGLGKRLFMPVQLLGRGINMSSNSTISRTIVFLFLLLGNLATAYAATCSVTDVTSTTVSGQVNSQDCIGVISDPKVDSESWMNSYNLTGAFGTDLWEFAAKIQNSDDPNIPPIQEIDIDVSFVITPDVDGEQFVGTWSLDASIFETYSMVALVLKAGPEFSVYLLDSSSITGEWSILGWAGGGLSHASIYVVSAVPLPAAVWLFGSGLIGLVAFNRRKQFS
jgi:hypothetical protein